MLSITWTFSFIPCYRLYVSERISFIFSQVTPRQKQKGELHNEQMTGFLVSFSHCEIGYVEALVHLARRMFLERYY